MTIIEFRDWCDRIRMLLDHLPYGYLNYRDTINDRLTAIDDDVDIMVRVTTSMIMAVRSIEDNLVSILGEDYAHVEYCHQLTD